MAAEASRSGGAADSYIGSLISLTSKCEIRYEGILYNINTEESSIGLRNVRSFGTEGRKKDGPQVPPNDKVYEYILFRGSDIKDLQVKSSPPVQSTPPIHNDPAIIQSHYPQSASVSTTLPPAGNGSVTDINSHTAQLGLPRSTFQGGLQLYQPGGSLGSWGSSPPPPSANGSGLAMPMYWQGYYGPSSGLPHVQQQSLLRPPPGLAMPPSMQQPMPPSMQQPMPPSMQQPLPPSMQQPMQYPGMNASLPAASSNLTEFSPNLIPPVSGGSPNLISTNPPPSTLPSTMPSVQSSAVVSETSSSLISNKASTPALLTAALNSSLPLVSPLTTTTLDVNPIVPPIYNKPKTVPGPTLPYQNTSQSVSSIVGTSSSSRSELSTPSLVTPGQLSQPVSAPLPSSQPSQPSHKDVEVVQASSSEPPTPAPTESKEPILPLPSPFEQKLNGGPSHTRYIHRGRERGRGNGVSRPVTKFTEEFDFMAMNEKFNKDEVWGHLGKSNKTQFRDGGNGKEADIDDSLDEDDAGSSKSETKPVYVKDDFFDSLSCNALDRGSRNGRTRFSEQMKIDTETFGDFPRHRGGRGGRFAGRGGYSRGSNYGRGYGYVGRGRGHAVSGRPN